jgi:hypothetical protein
LGQSEMHPRITWFENTNQFPLTPKELLCYTYLY